MSLPESYFDERKQKLVREMKMFGSLHSPEIEQAFLSVKRENFFPMNKQFAYADNAFPIGFGQTISQPSTISIMLELLGAQKGMKVLEIGSGCGYVQALLSKIVGEKGKVFGIDIVPELSEMSKSNLETEGIKNASIKFGNGRKGWQDEKPFDRILISAACSDFPNDLILQLANGGRMVAPIGERGSQEITALVKNGDGKASREKASGYFIFVPLK